MDKETPGKFEKKRFIVTFSNGQIWSVPVASIAHERADYYAENDTLRALERKEITVEGIVDFRKEVYDREYVYTLEDNDELVDWFRNNANWSDVAEFAVFIGYVPDAETLNDLFGDAEIEVE